MKQINALLLLVLSSLALAAPKLDPSLLATLQTQKTADILISFRDADVQNVRTEALSQARALGGSRTATIQSMFDALTAHSDAIQANVLDLLRKEISGGQKIIPLWITNQIGVRGADIHLINQLSTMQEISEIIESRKEKVDQPMAFRKLFKNYTHAGEQWGVARIEAPSVWAEGNKGEGAVIGSISSGVRVTHEALREAYREDHGWYDPVDSTLIPSDPSGAGTHEMGIILGRANGIGVAPEAQFIACNGRGRNFFDYTELIACGQFMVCPHLPTGPREDPRCDLAPVAIINDWGVDSRDADGFYDQVLETWIAAGIAPVFSTSFGYRACNVMPYPAVTPQTITVGPTDVNNTVSYYGSSGPGSMNQLKPNVAAPGEETISADASSDTAYASVTGAQNAPAHATGLIALLHSKRPGLRISQVERALIAGAQPAVPYGMTCNGLSDSLYPNYQVGYGIINAPASVGAVA